MDGVPSLGPKTERHERHIIVKVIKKIVTSDVVVFSRYVFPRRYGTKESPDKFTIGDKKIYFSRALTKAQSWQASAWRQTRKHLVLKGVPVGEPVRIVDDGKSFGKVRFHWEIPYGESLVEGAPWPSHIVAAKLLLSTARHGAFLQSARVFQVHMWGRTAS
eukprot:3910576-Amphidinium_carterae.1